MKNDSLDYLNIGTNPLVQRLLENAQYNKSGFAGLEKRKEPEDLVKYRAYSTRGRRDNRRETFDIVDLWELHVKRYPLHKENFDWQRRNPNEKPLVLVGGEKRVTLVHEPRYYQETGADYVAVPTQLIKRRFHNVSEIEISEFIEDAKLEDSGIDVMLEQPISGIASVREILEASAEGHLLHPVVASADPEFEGKDEYERHNYTITFEPVSCGYMDCSLDVDKVNEFLEPQFFLLGESIHSQEFKQARLKYRERKMRIKKLKKMRTFLKAMTVLDSTWAVLDGLDAIDNDSELIKAKALEELEKEEGKQ